MEHAHKKSLALGWCFLHSYSYAKRIKIVPHHPPEIWTFWQNFKFGSLHDDMETVYLACKWKIYINNWLIFCIIFPILRIGEDSSDECLLWNAEYFKLIFSYGLLFDLWPMHPVAMSSWREPNLKFCLYVQISVGWRITM